MSEEEDKPKIITLEIEDESINYEFTTPLGEDQIHCMLLEIEYQIRNKYSEHKYNRIVI